MCITDNSLCNTVYHRRRVLWRAGQGGCCEQAGVHFRAPRNFLEKAQKGPHFFNFGLHKQSPFLCVSSKSTTGLFG